MSISKAWDWEKERRDMWQIPSEESYYIASRWKEKGVQSVLDFGCGLGRHAVHFAKEGFTVSAFDLSETAIDNLNAWAARENRSIDARVSDMLHIPYPDNSFDAVFAYHVISHTDSSGIGQILGEIARVLRPGGELYMTLCSKQTWSFQDAGYPRLDENTVIKTDPGPENGIPHFFVNLEEAIALLHDFEIIKIRHVDDCYFDGQKHNSKHYFILATLGEAETDQAKK